MINSHDYLRYADGRYQLVTWRTTEKTAKKEAIKRTKKDNRDYRVNEFKVADRPLFGVYKRIG